MGFGSGEAFIPEVDGKGRGWWLWGSRLSRKSSLHQRLHVGDEAMHAFGLAAVGAGEQDGIADDDACASVTAGEAEDGALVTAGLGPLQGHEGLCDAKNVGERDADAASADIEPEPDLRRSAHAMMIATRHTIDAALHAFRFAQALASPTE